MSIGTSYDNFDIRRYIFKTLNNMKAKLNRRMINEMTRIVVGRIGK